MMPNNYGPNSGDIVKGLVGLLQNIANDASDPGYKPFDATVSISNALNCIESYLIAEMEKVAPGGVFPDIRKVIHDRYDNDQFRKEIVERIDANSDQKGSKPIYEIVTSEECNKINRLMIRHHLEPVMEYLDQLDRYAETASSTQFN